MDTTVSQDDVIAAAVRAAQAAAANIAGAGAATDLIPNTSGAVVAAAPVQQAAAVSLDDLMNQGGMSVKGFIKVDKTGFMFGTDMSAFGELDVAVVINEAQPHFALRYTIGDKTTYLKSYNRVTDSRSGKSWAQCIADAQKLDAKCRGDYPAVDVPVVIATEVVSQREKGKVLAEVGDRFGITTSVTNFNLFKEFIAAATRAGYSRDQVLAGKLEHEARRGNGNTWGLAHWKNFKPGDMPIALGDEG
jgi:hypothetical protein